MRLFISLGESSVNELKFDRGPIYVGRQMGSQVFLPDKSVSRQHAVFYTTKDGTWIIEDLGSSNKTHLNSQPIHKAEIQHNDVVRIADFLIRVSLEPEEGRADENKAEETLVGVNLHKDLHTVERNLDSHDAPPIKFPAKRIKAYSEAIDLLQNQKTLESLFRSAMDIIFRQFKAKNVWMGFRKAATGPMDIEDGKKITTEHLERVDLAIPASLAEVTLKNTPLLIHQLPRQITNRGVRSVVIAPISANENNHGVIYVANSTDHPHYSLPDLDYLILLTTYIGHKIETL